MCCAVEIQEVFFYVPAAFINKILGGMGGRSFWKSYHPGFQIVFSRLEHCVTVTLHVTLPVPCWSGKFS